MIWLTWRQFRFPAGVVLAAAAALALMLVAAGVPDGGAQALEPSCSSPSPSARAKSASARRSAPAACTSWASS